MSAQDPTLPGERLVTQFSREQRGWMVAALVAFVGVVFIGPAITSTAASGRALGRRTAKRVRRLGGGSMQTISAQVDRFRR